MKISRKILTLIFGLLVSFYASTQETLPIYTDYLSDNVYLVHPSAAGIGNCSKARFTARQQWAGVPDAPSLQTLSFHTKFREESNAGYGFILFNDKNGYHSQKGIQGTYSYHLQLSDGNFFNQLSFGVSFTAVQNQVDQRTFLGDPAVAAIVQSSSYYNADFSMAYHYDGFSSYFTVKNLFLSAKNSLGPAEPLNLKNYIFSASYYYGEDNLIQLEPSIMVQVREGIGQRIADFNLKAYKNLDNSVLWAALSYRRGFDSNPEENLQYFSPIIGLNYKNMMFSYTYTKQTNDVVLIDSGLHQITVGFDLFCRTPRATACPNINSAYNGF
jgi:type IX secretion system PorP/SprF family membrane protein